MNRKLAALLSELPPRPDHNPVRKAIALAAENAEVSGALKHFSSLPPSTGVIANPVRHHREIMCKGSPLELEIRSFTIRGLLFEEDIIAGRADATAVIFTGLFGRKPDDGETLLLANLISDSFHEALGKPLRRVAEFMKICPSAPPDTAAQHWASFRKGLRDIGAVNLTRPQGELLAEMIALHMENVAVSACSSYMRGLLKDKPRFSPSDLTSGALKFIRGLRLKDPFEVVFSLLLRRKCNADESRVLGQLGAIQVHHGSAGSNMVARYLASLHTRSVSDLFTAAQMTLDCGRHFGAISDMTDFVRELERTPQSKRDDSIRERILKGGLPTFGHPEIAAAGRANRLEMDPRPALYLAPLFQAIDDGTIAVSPRTLKRVGMLERIYQIALDEGVMKPGSTAALRLTPNTDFGAWLVQEVLEIEEPDRTLLSYAYRGFGWMMDVREQLQQPIIRPVIPPDPAITAAGSEGNVIPDTISMVHDRLVKGRAFVRRKA